MNANYFLKKSTCKSTQFSVCREWPLGDFYLIDQDNKLVGLAGRENPLSFGSDQLRALRMANQIKAGAPYNAFDVEVVRTNFGKVIECEEFAVKDDSPTPSRDSLSL
ncbi:hypothetical protein ACWM3R_001307 [Vibrio cholerae]